MKIFLISFLMMTSLNALAAKYEVPVEAELKPYASFELPDLVKSIDQGHVVVEYTLPVILTGNSQLIRLEGQIQPGQKEVTLEGEYGTATCNDIYMAAAQCSVTYTDLEINKKTAIQEIKKISKSQSETLGRIQVMRSFSTDPVGIINY